MSFFISAPPKFFPGSTTTSMHFLEVLYAVGELGNEMILPPSLAVPIKIQNSHRWHPYFKVRVDTRKLETLKGIMYLSH